MRDRCLAAASCASASNRVCLSCVWSGLGMGPMQGTAGSVVCCLSPMISMEASDCVQGAGLW